MIRAFSYKTAPGSKRALNEDAVLVHPERELFGVADGFGGKGIGDAAAKNALDAVRFFVENGLGDSEITLPFVYKNYLTDSGNLIFNAFLYANEKLVLENKTKTMNARGGASALFAFIKQDLLIIANVGCCQAMLVRNGQVSSLVRPRSYNAFRGYPAQRWVSRWAFPLFALGQSMTLEPEMMELRVMSGDLIVLATDGVYPNLQDADWLEFVQNLNDNPDLSLTILEQNQRVMSKAESSGGGDNVAMVTLVVGPDAPSQPVKVGRN